MKNKNKWILGTGAAITALAVLSGLAFGQNLISAEASGWTSQGAGKYSVVSEGVLVSEPTDEDYNHANAKRTEALTKGEKISEDASLNKSSDPLLPRQKLKNLDNKSAKALQNQNARVSYKPHSKDGIPEERFLYVQKLGTADGTVLVEDRTTATPHLIASPDNRAYLFEDNGLLYSIDSESLAVSQLTADEQQGVSLDELQSLVAESEDDVYLAWATQPFWSQDGAKVAYLSNRNSVGEEGGEIWLADPNNGEESQVYRSGDWLGLLGWTSAGDIVFWEGKKSNVRLLSLDGEATDLGLGEVYNAQLDPSGRWLVYSPTKAPAEFMAYAFDTGGSEPIASATSGLQFDPSVEFSKKGNKVLLVEYVDDSGDRLIHTFDLDTKQSGRIAPPSKVSITGVPQWVTDEQILVNGKEGDISNAWVVNTAEGGTSDEN